MRCGSITTLLVSVVISIFFISNDLHAANPKGIKHITVYREKHRFGGWPANHGIWSWGNEILVGFSRGHYKDLGPSRHAIDREGNRRWIEIYISEDNGKNWQFLSKPASDLGEGNPPSLIRLADALVLAAVSVGA